MDGEMKEGAMIFQMKRMSVYKCYEWIIKNSKWRKLI